MRVVNVDRMQVKIKQLTKELAAAREALHHEHGDHDMAELDEEDKQTGSGGDKGDGLRVPTTTSKSLSHNFPISGEALEMKETRSMKMLTGRPKPTLPVMLSSPYNPSAAIR
eukprot:7343608-Pyramimonas_sp.AAC.1